MMYCLDGSGISLSILFWWISTGFGITIRTRRGWFFSRRLFCTASAWCPYQEKYVTGYPHASTCGTGAPSTSWYRICTEQKKNFQEIIAGPKPRSNVTIIFQNLFYARSCAKPLDIFAREKKGDFCYLTNGRQIVWDLLKKPSWRYWRENIHLREKPIVLRWKRTRKLLFLFLWILRRMQWNWQRGNLQGTAGPNGTDSEDLQGWMLKFRDHKKNCISVESFVDQLANQRPPWAANKDFMSSQLITLDKLPGVHPVASGKPGANVLLSMC